MKEDIEELRANVERTEMAGLTFIATRAACARAALDYIAQLEQTSRAQRTNEAAGQAGLAKLQRYEPEVGSNGYGVRATMSEYPGCGGYVRFADVQALLAAPVAADTEQATIDTPELRELIGDVYMAGSHNESIEKSENALIRYLATPADAGAGLTEEEITEVVRRAIVDGKIIWAGFKKDASGHYTIPDLSPADFKLARAIEREVLARMSTPGAQVTASDAGGKANAECLLEEVAQLRQVIAGFAGGARQAASGDEVEMFLRWCDQVKLPIDAPDGSFSMRAFRWAKVAWLYRAALDNHSEELLDMAGQSPAPVTATDLLNELHRLFRTREWTDREGDWDDALVAVCEEIAKRIQVARGAVSAAPVTAEPVTVPEEFLKAAHIALVSLAHAAEKHGIYQIDYERFAAVVQKFDVDPVLTPAPADRDAIRNEALEEAAKACEGVQDKCQRRDGGKWPELRDDAESGAGQCAEAVRALKSMERAADAKGGEHE